MEKERYEEIHKICEDLLDQGKTFDEIEERLHKEFSEKEIDEFIVLLTEKVHEYLKKSKRNEK